VHAFQHLSNLDNKGFSDLSLLYRNAIAAQACCMQTVLVWKRFRRG